MHEIMYKWWSNLIVQARERCVTAEYLAWKELIAVQEMIQQLQSSIAKKQNALAKVLDWLENAPIDYSNGNTFDGVDEGEVRGWRAHNQLIEIVKAAMKEN